MCSIFDMNNHPQKPAACVSSLAYLVAWSKSNKQSHNVILGFYFKGNGKFCSQDTTAPEAGY